MHGIQQKEESMIPGEGLEEFIDKTKFELDLKKINFFRYDLYTPNCIHLKFKMQ